jgi:hypothetical protein
LERQLVSVGKQLDEMKDKQAALMGQSPEHADKVCVNGDMPLFLSAIVNLRL